MPDLFAREVLARLPRTDRTMLAQVGRPWRAAVEASGGGLRPTATGGWAKAWCLVYTRKRLSHRGLGESLVPPYTNSLSLTTYYPPPGHPKLELSGRTCV